MDSQQDLGGVAWLVLALAIACYDIGALRSKHHSTMSTAFYRASRKSRWNIVLVCGWLYLTGHLFRWVPHKFDVLRRLFG